MIAQLACALLGHLLTNRHVDWLGAPVFTFDGDRVRDLWVLGDIYGLLGQIRTGGMEGE